LRSLQWLAIFASEDSYLHRFYLIVFHKEKEKRSLLLRFVY
jgi:hypothetical protein